jgi:hypothetical protein
VHGIIDQFKKPPYLFITEFDSGGYIGGETTVYVKLIGSKDTVLARTFYFENNNEKHIRSFANKFANDLDYRQECLAGTVLWYRVSRWYGINDITYSDQFQTIRAACTKEELRRMEAQSEQTWARMEQLFRIIEKQVEIWETTKEYQEHLVLEQNFTPSLDVLDPEVEGIVHLFNLLPGVKTIFSCQGIRRGIRVAEWKYGPMWFPGNHEPLAHITFSQIPPELLERLDAHFRKLGLGQASVNRIISNLPQNNARFLAALEELINSVSM